MDFLKSYIRNLVLLVLVLGFVVCFVFFFYPNALPYLQEVGRFYTILRLWPLIILILLIYALPRRRR